MEQWLKQIHQYRKEADAFSEDDAQSLILKIEALSKCLVYVGKVSSIVDGDYKRIYANRKYQQAIEEVNAQPPKKANAEIAIHNLRMQEADAYESMQRWRNAFDSVKEEVHALKLKLRIIFQDGSNEIK